MKRVGTNTRAVKATAVAGAGDRGEQHKATSETQAQKVARQQALLAFLEAGFEDYKLYRDREDEDEVEEYRRAGKLHTYDPDKEPKKRLARVAKLHPPPEHMAEKIKLYTYYLEEDEDDFRIGLYSLIGDEIRV
ncbi:hypothetical protein CFC21_034631 [Triticum aestivum]|uniref:Uncharacterized protein n=3 Tax=Triticum TaxID=4564 RepID=A0A9R0VGH3_TRITD|nr:hypothetical protein CFC21_034631 [Triticum aestivum]VAH58791.1 unnamed protein product [Triticum turgidum subsp. durum]